MKAVYRPSSTLPSLAVGFCKQPSLIRAWATAPRPQKSAEFAASLLPSPFWRGAWHLHFPLWVPWLHCLTWGCQQWQRQGALPDRSRRTPAFRDVHPSTAFLHGAKVGSWSVFSEFQLCIVDMTIAQDLERHDRSIRLLLRTS